jgi:hypothetical protein
MKRAVVIASMVFALGCPMAIAVQLVGLYYSNALGLRILAASVLLEGQVWRNR